MNENLRKQLEDNGADVSGTLKRFMNNDAIYMKFIMKFLEDKNYDGVIENFEKADYGALFNSAHTLKGVTANLGLDPISSVAAQMSDLLRNKQPQEIDVEKLKELRKQLEEVYFRFINILKENKQ